MDAIAQDKKKQSPQQLRAYDHTRSSPEFLSSAILTELNYFMNAEQSRLSSKIACGLLQVEKVPQINMLQAQLIMVSALQSVPSGGNCN